MIFALGTILLVLYFQNKAKQSDKAADILAKQVANKNDHDLNNKILKAAENSPAEKKIRTLMSKHRWVRPPVFNQENKDLRNPPQG
jgi:hypothetical protein